MSVIFTCDFCGEDLGAFCETYGDWRAENGYTMEYWDDGLMKRVVVCDNEEYVKDKDGNAPYLLPKGCWYDFCSAAKIIKCPPDKYSKIDYYKKEQ